MSHYSHTETVLNIYSFLSLLQHPWLKLYEVLEIYLNIKNYRPKRNALILLDMGHTLRGEHAQEK
jgi:hypothetical protein